eukprot:8923418-Pyramimonas_sp.AAC.1
MLTAIYQARRLGIPRGSCQGWGHSRAGALIGYHDLAGGVALGHPKGEPPGLGTFQEPRSDDVGGREGWGRSTSRASIRGMFEA